MLLSMKFHWFNHLTKKYVSTLSSTILDAPFQAKPSAKADVQGRPTLENGLTWFDQMEVQKSFKITRSVSQETIDFPIKYGLFL